VPCAGYREWRKGGTGALKAAGRAGRKPRLSAAQLRRVEAALLKGARHHGFNAELWTLPRVARVVERETAVHPGHIWKILGSMNWTAQKPERQAKERDEAKVPRGNHWSKVSVAAALGFRWDGKAARLFARTKAIATTLSV
jgi:transposase